MKRERENEDHPSKCASVGCQGEVPPGYNQSLNSNSRARNENTAAMRPMTNWGGASASKEEGILKTHLIQYT